MIKVGAYDLELKIIRKKIKNLYLRLENHTLIVTCPYFITDQAIRAFIMAKEKWIVFEMAKKSISYTHIQDAKIWLLGKAYEVSYDIDIKEAKWHNEVLNLPGNDEESALKSFYLFALPYLKEEVEKALVDFLPLLKEYGYNDMPKVKYRYLKRAWGICHFRKNYLVLNLKLLHFPPKVIRAVLWHECVHFLCPSHNKAFYNLLYWHMPDYDEAINMLK